MLLAFGGGVGDQGRVFQPFRLFENLLRDIDVVVEREHVDHARRGVDDRRQPVREPGARLGFDGADQAHHDVVEYADLLFWITCRAADKQVGDARQHFDAPRVGAGTSGGLELVDQRKDYALIGRMPAAHCNTDDNAARTVKKGLRQMVAIKKA